MRDERGSAPIWFLGLAVCVLMVGALSAELWRVIGERQELVAIADAAAIAGASVIDLDKYRSTGELAIDPEEAGARVLNLIAASDGSGRLAAPPSIAIATDRIEVTLVREVPYGLLRVLALDDDGFLVTATAVAYPASP
ncbi:MAG TPA: pilus assembly protein TadG-related protein [Acidimicrobiia bacterium]